MQSVNIVTASSLLGISCQRIRQLIYKNRVKGAFKSKIGWQIPLYRQMPQILPGTRGPKGTWRVQRQRKPTIIHINKNKIAANHQKQQKDPVIIVRQNSKVTYGYGVSFNGQCRIIYDPDNQKKHGGAKVWIEVEENTKIFIDQNFLR